MTTHQELIARLRSVDDQYCHTAANALQTQAERIKAQDSEIERLNHKDKMITKWTENGELVEREAQGAVPVAWRYVSANGVYRYCKHRPNRDMAKEYAILEPVPLYTHAPNAWFDGYNAAVKDAVNKGVYEDGKHVGFLAKSSADSVGEYYLAQFSAPPESTAQAAPKDELGDLRSALWLSDEALKTCRVEAPGTRFKEKNFSESAVARALAAINALLAAPQPQKKEGV